MSRGVQQRGCRFAGCKDQHQLQGRYSEASAANAPARRGSHTCCRSSPASPAARVVDAERLQLHAAGMGQQQQRAVAAILQARWQDKLPIMGTLREQGVCLLKRAAGSICCCPSVRP